MKSFEDYATRLMFAVGMIVVGSVMVAMGVRSIYETSTAIYNDPNPETYCIDKN